MKNLQMKIELTLEVPDTWGKSDYAALYRSLKLADGLWKQCSFMDQRVSVVEETELDDV